MKAIFLDFDGTIIDSSKDLVDDGLVKTTNSFYLKLLKHFIEKIQNGWDKDILAQIKL